MLVKMYWMVWAVTAIAAMLVFLTGNFTLMMATVFGFIAFGLVFMGMIGVLPTMVSHPERPKPVVIPATAPVLNANPPVPNEAFGVLKSA
ncbi:MAG: hypothetical protein ABI791_15555 [Acidobacteriota bacterium]